jgi:hypothetical protein
MMLWEIFHGKKVGDTNSIKSRLSDHLSYDSWLDASHFDKMSAFPTESFHIMSRKDLVQLYKHIG